MRNNSTIASLKAMRFSAMAAELERQMQDSSVYLSLIQNNEPTRKAQLAYPLF